MARPPPIVTCAPFRVASNAGRRGERTFVERQVLERLLERLASRQAEAADGAFVVVHDQALSARRRPGRGDGELQGRIAVDAASYSKV